LYKVPGGSADDVCARDVLCCVVLCLPIAILIDWHTARNYPIEDKEFIRLGTPGGTKY